MLTILMMLKTTKLGLKSFKKMVFEDWDQIESQIVSKKFVFRVESDHGIFKSFQA